MPTPGRRCGHDDFEISGRLRRQTGGRRNGQNKNLQKSVAIVVDNFIETGAAADETLSETAKNGRLRKTRNEAWREAEAATRYWRVRLDFDGAVEHAQRLEIPEARYHPIVNPEDRYRAVP
jgi:hypothetical protein